MVTVRADARFCSTRCRVAGNRARRRRRYPAALEQRASWVRRDARKVPLAIDGTPASSTDPATWSTLTEASASRAGVGLGFMLGDGIGCIDLDHCFDGSELHPWARAVIDANPGTFVEVSQSGDGLHVFGLLDAGPGRRIRDGRNIEVYSTGRYIAVTGDRFERAPLALAPLELPAL